jgi:hypothetical protein
MLLALLGMQAGSLSASADTGDNVSGALQPGGSAVAGQSVALMSTTLGHVNDSVSAADGTFAFELVGPGTYYVVIAPEVGFVPYTSANFGVFTTDIVLDPITLTRLESSRASAWLLSTRATSPGRSQPRASQFPASTSWPSARHRRTPTMPRRRRTRPAPTPSRLTPATRIPCRPTVPPRMPSNTGITSVTADSTWRQ